MTGFHRVKVLSFTATVSLICASFHFPAARDFRSPPSAFASLLWRAPGCPAWPSECAGQSGTSPVGWQRKVWGIIENRREWITLSQLYRVRAGELAGDVECDQVFTNNYVRHAVAVISHLEMDKNDLKRLSELPRGWDAGIITHWTKSSTRTHIFRKLFDVH